MSSSSSYNNNNNIGQFPTLCDCKNPLPLVLRKSTTLTHPARRFLCCPNPSVRFDYVFGLILTFVLAIVLTFNFDFLLVVWKYKAYYFVDPDYYKF